MLLLIYLSFIIIIITCNQWSIQ